MHAGLTVSLRTVAPPRRGEHVLGEGALGTERGRRPGADVARRLFRYRGETVDRMPTARSSSWGGRTRTSNFPVNSRAVCQLTYTPMLPSLPPHRERRICETHSLDAAARHSCWTRSGEQERGARKTCAPGAARCRGRVHEPTATLRRPAPGIRIQAPVAVRAENGERHHGPTLLSPRAASKGPRAAGHRTRHARRPPRNPPAAGGEQVAARGARAAHRHDPRCEGG